MRILDDLRWRLERRWDVLRRDARARRRAIVAGGAAVLLACAGMATLGGVRSGPRLAARVPMVDAATARIFWISTVDRAVMVPAAHPDTGARTLVGVDRGEDGSWRILEQDLAVLATLGVRVSSRIDVRTGAVRPAGEDE